MHVTIDRNSHEFGNFEPHHGEFFIDVSSHSFEKYFKEDVDNIPVKKINLNLINDRVKVLIEAHDSPFHYLTGIYGAISNALDMFDNPLIVINMSRIKSPFCSQKMVAFLYHFLEDNNIDYFCVDKEDSVGIHINNFFLYKFGEYPIPNSINGIHNMFLKYVEDINITPYKKVYVGRKMVKTELPPINKGQESDLIRIDDEDKLENFFKSHGFEIIYPEDFKSFKDQINYFYSVKTIASITGGGAMNLVFMQNGGNVIEIISPIYSLFNGKGNPEGKEYGDWIISHHNFFSNISYKRELIYTGISNPEKKADDAINKIINSNAAMSVIRETVYWPKWYKII